jgi:hypothetical protein
VDRRLPEKLIREYEDRLRESFDPEKRIKMNNIIPYIYRFFTKYDEINSLIERSFFEKLSECLVDSGIVDDSVLIEDNDAYCLTISGSPIANIYKDVNNKYGLVVELIKLLIDNTSIREYDVDIKRWNKGVTFTFTHKIN